MPLTRIEAAAIVGAIGSAQITDASITGTDIAPNTILTSNLQLSDDWGLVTGSITATDDYGSLT